MHPSTAMARVLVDELARGGVTEAVLSPGSRSASLAIALHDEPRIRLHVRIDERSAGYLALGLAAVSGRPVIVLCTSGTAAANLHPAVLEAAHGGVPLIVLTADRPPELRGTGANQSVDQIGLYGAAVRLSVEVGAPAARPGGVRYWRSIAARAVAAAQAPGDPGPVHLNLGLREPLVPDGDESWPEPLDEQPDGSQWTEVRRGRCEPDALERVLGSAAPERGAVVVGSGAVDPRGARALAEAAGWPVLSEPTGNARAGDNSIATYPLLLADSVFAATHRPELVVTVGKPGLSRSLLGWLDAARQQIVVDPRAGWADPGRRADVVLSAVPTVPPRRPTDWLRAWQTADMAARESVDRILDGIDDPSEPRIARDLVAGLPRGALLLVGSSRPIRDVEAYAAVRGDLTVVGNRGVSGIDGLISTAVGAAIVHSGPSYALLGDLAFLHDHGGLIQGPEEVRADLTIVVVDNDGGGIFSMLPGRLDGFDRIFGTPHGLDLAAVAVAAGWPTTVLDRAADLARALRGPGPRVVLARTNRQANAGLHDRLQAAVNAAL